MNFYGCAISIIESPLDQVYDWSADVMNVQWSSKAALEKLKERPTTLVCDALLDQNIFSGVGNIIKNEVLFRIRVHPKSQVGKLPSAKKLELLREAVAYSFQFLEWKKQFVLKANWLAHTKKICPRAKNKIIKQYLGKTNRRTFFCSKCQTLYR